jgi:CRP-like cAMP-binding protein
MGEAKRSMFPDQQSPCHKPVAREGAPGMRLEMSGNGHGLFGRGQSGFRVAGTHFSAKHRLKIGLCVPGKPGEFGMSLNGMDRFASLGQEERHHLEAALTTRIVPARTSLFSEGDTAGTLYLLADGWAFRHQTARNGSRQIVGLALPGDFCNLDVLAFGRIDYGVRMLTPGTLLTIERDKALALGVYFPAISALFAQTSFVENAILSRWTFCLGRLSAQERLAHLLCELAVRRGYAQDRRQVRIELPLTQEQLADVLGLTGVHVNRVLQQLRSRGLVAKRGRMVEIFDFPALRAMAGFEPAYLHRDTKRMESVAA